MQDIQKEDKQEYLRKRAVALKAAVFFSVFILMQLRSSKTGRYIEKSRYTSVKVFADSKTEKRLQIQAGHTIQISQVCISDLYKILKFL